MTPSQTNDRSSDLLTLAQWMAGDFSNQAQAIGNPQHYAHLHVFFRPLPFSFFGSIGFYSEQVHDYDLWSPYRQGVHRLVDQGDQIYIENYGLKDSIRYAGAARELSILNTITPDCIARRFDCSMVFTRSGDRFLGGVEPGNRCMIERDGCPTYLISDVVVTENTWESLDRGMNPETHEQVWGSIYGSLKFEKRLSFADEVPLNLA